MASNPSSTDDAAVKLEDDVSLGSFACSHGRLTPESAALSKLKVISFHAASLLDVGTRPDDYSEMSAS